MAWQHFELLRATLTLLGLQEVAHKACLPAYVMTWLSLQFDTEHMTVTIPEEKPRDTFLLMEEWIKNTIADIHVLMSLLGRLFHMHQCSHLARLFVNCMMAMSVPHLRSHATQPRIST